MSWKMISSTEFQMDERGYHVDLVVGGFYPTWSIVKDGLLIDVAQNHHPVTSDCNKELAAKSQVEKVLKSLP